MRRLILTAALLLAAGAPRAAEPVRVAVSILPQAWFVEQLAGDAVTVQVLVGPGESPASFDPTPRQMAELSRARLLLTIGVPMENSLLPRLSRGLPDLRLVDVRAGMDLLPSPAHAGHDHDHDHGETDPHVWLSPAHARTLAANTATALAELLPEREAAIRSALADLDARLAALAAEVAAILEPLRGADLLVFHPSFGYLCADHGLRQVAVEQGGQSPSARHLGDVLRRARDGGARTIFVQPQFSESSARAVAREAGLAVTVLDPLPRDYPDGLRALAAAVRAGVDPVEADADAR